MKKTAALLLSVLLMALALGGCQEKKELPTMEVVTGEGIKELPLVTMWVDLPDVGGVELKQFLDSLPGHDKEFHISYESVDGFLDSTDYAVQEARMTRLRTEMMAGKGPDLFLCDSITRQADVDGDRKLSVYTKTFPFPQKLMGRNAFLNLDSYIEKAQYMEWDKLDPLIMEAGRTESGQVLLPLGYDFDICYYNEAELTKTYDLPMTHQEMIDSGDPVLLTAANPLEYGIPLSREEFDRLDDLNLEYKCSDGQILELFRDPVDFKEEELNFTQEEFAQLVKEAWELQKRRDEIRPEGEGHFYFLPDWGLYLAADSGAFSKEDQQYLVVPRYNDQGGITATVAAYGAVNANASYPEYAFRVLDYLLSETSQRGLSLTGEIRGFPVYMGLGTEDSKVQGRSGWAWFMTDYHYQQFLTLHDQINAVRFESPLDAEANVELWQRYREGGYTEKALDDAIDTAYRTMKMMLAES